jgi:hypothetical protein
MINKEICKIIVENLKVEGGITLFNYDAVVKNIISEITKLGASHDTLSQVSLILHHELFDIYETALRDKANWERYFWNAVPKMVAEIDTNDGLNGEIPSSEKDEVGLE